MGATQELLSKTQVLTDRNGWARRGHAEFGGNSVLALEVKNNDLTGAADSLDDWATACGGEVTEIQHVYRRGKRVVYGRVTKS